MISNYFSPPTISLPNKEHIRLVEVLIDLTTLETSNFKKLDDLWELWGLITGEIITTTKTLILKIKPQKASSVFETQKENSKDLL